MGSFLWQFLAKEHGGKTVSVTTIIAAVAVAIQLGWEPPVPATRGYVDQAITTGTKGLDYLVQQAIEADVDLVAYEVRCMNESWKQSQLDRLKAQYRELVGSAYVEKDCVELERRVQRVVGQPPP